MKKIVRKVGIIIMALTTMITMHACTQINKETANEVCAALSEKYGESFVAVKIGDRFNTDSAKLYLHPADNEAILFVARINRKTGVIEDNYIEEKVNVQVEKAVADAFLKNGIVVSSRCMVVTKDPIAAENAEYSPKGFQEEYKFDHYTLYLIVEEGDFKASDLLSSVKEANENIGVKLVIAGYVFAKDTYSECAVSMKNNPEMNITMIEALSPAASFNVNVNQGVCSISEDALTEKLGRN